MLCANWPPKPLTCIHYKRLNHLYHFLLPDELETFSTLLFLPRIISSVVLQYFRIKNDNFKYYTMKLTIYNVAKYFSTIPHGFDCWATIMKKKKTHKGSHILGVYSWKIQRVLQTENQWGKPGKCKESDIKEEPVCKSPWTKLQRKIVKFKHQTPQKTLTHYMSNCHYMSDCPALHQKMWTSYMSNCSPLPNSS